MGISLINISANFWSGDDLEIEEGEVVMAGCRIEREGKRREEGGKGGGRRREEEGGEAIKLRSSGPRRVAGKRKSSTGLMSRERASGHLRSSQWPLRSN